MRGLIVWIDKKHSGRPNNQRAMILDNNFSDSLIEILWMGTKDIEVVPKTAICGVEIGEHWTFGHGASNPKVEQVVEDYQKLYAPTVHYSDEEKGYIVQRLVNNGVTLKRISDKTNLSVEYLKALLKGVSNNES